MSKKFKRILGVVAAIAIPFAAPAIASAIGLSTAIGATAGSALVGAGLGATSAAVTGGDVGRGALLGGIGGGVAGYFSAPAAPATAPASAGGAVPNAVVTNVGSGTGYWSPELLQYVDPGTGNTILSQNIAYGGNLAAPQLTALQQGQLSASQLAGVGTSAPMLSALSVNTPTAAAGFGAPQLGATTYFNPAAGVEAFAPQASFTNAAGQAVPTSPSYTQAGLDIPGRNLATVGQGTTTGGAPQPGVPTMTAGAAATSLIPGGAPGQTYGSVSGAGAQTFTQALKNRLTSPEGLADLTLRAAGLIAGSAIAGEGMSGEERALLDEQVRELRELQQTNRALFDQRLEQAQNLLGESRYFDPEYFGLQRARRVQMAAARMKRAGLQGLSGAAREAEARRFDIAAARESGTAFDQGYQTGLQGRLQTTQAGLQAMPSGLPSSAGAYSNLRSAYASAAQRARGTQEDIGELFGSLSQPRRG